MQLDLNPEQKAVLEDTLELDLSDLSYQIGNTDNYDFRNDLKHKANILKDILTDLRSSGG